MKHEEVTEKIIGVFYDVYNELGHGFLEAVYEEAMMIALTEAGLEVKRQAPIPIRFRGRNIGDYKADLLVGGKVLVELKAVRALASEHEAQTIHYLQATDIEIALLLNFGPRPQVRRFILDNDRKRSRTKASKESVSIREIRG
ncbi:MAG: GxxExxY protein [Acidobacteriales bacterium]|nr:GxxExxY protein [Terriglobales bacterium]